MSSVEDLSSTGWPWRRGRAAAVLVFLGTACCGTLALWAREGGAQGSSRGELLLQADATSELARANAEISGYDSELRFGHVSAPARIAGRQTELWNAAANDEVHVDQNGRLLVSTMAHRVLVCCACCVPSGSLIHMP